MSPQIAQYWLVFLKGAGITLWLSWLALMLGGVIGVGIALARLSPWRLLRGAALAYTEVLRSFPPLILFFGCFYGISYAFGLDLSPFAAATVALSAQASAFMSEVVRSGVESVGRGQWEAARSSGLAYWQIMRHVVGPQAVPVMLPPAVGVYISTLKDSSLSIAALAKAAGLGISQFHTVFRRETGKTPGEMLRDVRLQKASTLLQETNLSIAEIALVVGFSDQTAFTRCLRRFRATTPDALRRRSAASTE